MKDARRSRQRRDQAYSGRKRRSTAGVVAEYIHELSARHEEQRRRRPARQETRLRSEEMPAAVDESWDFAESLRGTTVQPCEGA